MLKEELILTLSLKFTWILSGDVVLGYCRSSYSECLFFFLNQLIYFFKYLT